MTPIYISLLLWPCYIWKPGSTNTCHLSHSLHGNYLAISTSKTYYVIFELNNEPLDCTSTSVCWIRRLKQLKAQNFFVFDLNYQLNLVKQWAEYIKFIISCRYSEQNTLVYIHEGNSARNRAQVEAHKDSTRPPSFSLMSCSLRCFLHGFSLTCPASYIIFLKLSYCVFVWGTMATQNYIKLLLLQKKALRIQKHYCGMSWYLSTHGLSVKYSLLRYIKYITIDCGTLRIPMYMIILVLLLP